MKTPAKILILLAVGTAVVAAVALKQPRTAALGEAASGPVAAAKLPRLVDLGAGKCIPCKLMKPILDDLQRSCADHFITEFIDVWENPDEGKRRGVDMIPTQIFYSADGKELFRHTGFYGKEDILGKWKELGVDVGKTTIAPIVREQPVAADTRPRDQVCFVCDGDVNAKTRSLVKGASERRVLCSPHCYFIYFSSLVGPDAKAVDATASVTDWASGNLTPATSATYLYGLSPKGRPTIKAFAEQSAAVAEQRRDSGSLLGWSVLRAKELATRCAFCDRAVYPEDACSVKFGATHGYGCCTHCSLGVAARLRLDIEVAAPDALTGETIQVKTLDGKIASLEPAGAVAWFGQKRDAEGKWVSAGCFKQGFFVNAANLQRWLDARPAMTGRQITIAQALADKMKLSPEQIAKACKLGECK